MRKLIFAINVSADGCCDHTMFNPDDEVLDYFTQLMRAAGILLYGRKTYELMVPYWPDIAKSGAGSSKAENEFAQAFAAVPQIFVASKTLNKVEDNKTTILHSHLRDEILKLKRGQGGNILTGGVSFPSELIKLGIVDELRIVVHPLITGKGRRLFEDLNLQENLKLELVETKAFKSGCLELRYLKR